jgi:hypothetical protein
MEHHAAGYTPKSIYKDIDGTIDQNKNAMHPEGKDEIP